MVFKLKFLFKISTLKWLITNFELKKKNSAKRISSHTGFGSLPCIWYIITSTKPPSLFTFSKHAGESITNIGQGSTVVSLGPFFRWCSCLCGLPYNQRLKEADQVSISLWAAFRYPICQSLDKSGNCSTWGFGGTLWTSLRREEGGKTDFL